MFDLGENKWTEVSRMRHRRQSHACAVVDNTLFSLGGFDGLQIQSSVEKYGAANEEWTYVASMLSPRYQHVCATVNNHIYTFGGFTSGGQRETSVERYDPVADVGLVVGDVEVNGDDHPCYGGAVVVNNAIYFTGHKDNGGATYRYDPRLRGINLRRVTALPSPASGYGVTVYDNSIFVIGGVHSVGGYQGTVQIYDVRADRWRVGAAMPAPRVNVECVTLEEAGCIVAMGGFYDGYGEPWYHKTANRYYPANDAWY